MTSSEIHVQQLEHGKTCKYLGTEKHEGMQHEQMEEILKLGHTVRLRIILKSEFNAKDKIMAIGTLVF
jgi:hypothetical protein